MGMDEKWNNQFEYWCHHSSNGDFNLTDKTPSDWVLTIGKFYARLSWKGDADNGTWQFSTPIIFRYVVDEGKPVNIEWQETGLSDLSEAKLYVEQKVAEALSIMREGIEVALSELTSRKFTRIVNGVEVTCESTNSL